MDNYIAKKRRKVQQLAGLRGCLLRFLSPARVAFSRMG